MCLSGDHIESLFIYNDDFKIDIVKSKSKYENDRWFQSFGKSLTRNVVEAKIIHTNLGLTIPLKRYASSQKSQTIEFAGLHGYDEKADQLNEVLEELQDQFQHEKLTRIDVAIDFKSTVPKKIIKMLCEKRKTFQYGNTTYYKTVKEKKTNQKMDIKIYNKAKESKLDYPLMRLEFVFKGSYFNKLLLKDLDLVIKMMEKSIKRATGLSVKIEADFRASRMRA